MNELPDASASPERTHADALQWALRFLRVVLYRKQFVLAALAVALLLGGLYYFTATRIYRATASLLVTTTGPDVWTTSTMASSGRENRMPTYERLFHSAVVLEAALERIEQLPPQARIDFASEPRDRWSIVLGQHLAAHSVRNTDIIEIGYRSKSPEAAEMIVEAVVDAYLEFMEKHHKDVSVEIISILDKERREIEQRLVEKQQDLLAVKHRVRDLGLRQGSNVVHPAVQRVVELNDKLVEVQGQRLQLEALLTAVKLAARQGGDLRQHLMSLDPDVGRELIMNAMGLDPQSIEAMHIVERKLIDDRAKLDTWLAHLGPRHPDVVELTRSVQGAEEFIRAYQARLGERARNRHGDQLGPLLTTMLKQRLAETRAHEVELHEEYLRSESEAVALNDRMAELQIAEHELQRLRNLHETLLNRISNIDINQDRGHVRAAVVSYPSALDRPVSPRLSMVLVLCVGGGLAAGVGLVYVLDVIDDRFRSPEEIREQLGVPLLAMIRRLPPLKESGPAALQVHVAPEDVESEAFRTLRTALAFSGQQLERLAITSSEPGDGKTTVLANLGTAYAQAGKRTLLIDADLRRPGLSKLLDLRSVDGLSNLLRSGDDVGQLAQQLVQESGVPNLDVFPSGPRPSDPAELLTSRRMEDLVAWAEQNYEQVFIDCPPILAASDAAIAGRLVDGIMLVVQPDQNHRRAVVRAVENLAAMRVNLVGIVANRVSQQRDGSYYGYGYGYGNGYGQAENEADARRRDDDAPLHPDLDEGILQPRRAA